MTLWFNESYILSQFETVLDDLDKVSVERVEMDGEMMRYTAFAPAFTVTAWDIKRLGQYVRAIDGTLGIEPEDDKLAFTFTAHEKMHMPMD